MKVFKDGCHCFTCNKSWDIFTFVQDIEKCDFRTAFLKLGGTYEKINNKKGKILHERKFKVLKEERSRQEKDKNFVKKEVLFCISVVQTVIKIYEPETELWCEAQNELPVLYGLLNELTSGEEIKAIDVFRRCERIRRRFIAV